MPRRKEEEERERMEAEGKCFDYCRFHFTVGRIGKTKDERAEKRLAESIPSVARRMKQGYWTEEGDFRFQPQFTIMRQRGDAVQT